MKLRTPIVVLTAGLALGVGGTVAAQATVFTNHSTSTNTLISAKCYHHVGSSTTTFRWVKAQNRYVAYTSPHRSSTSYNTCHA